VGPLDRPLAEEIPGMQLTSAVGSYAVYVRRSGHPVLMRAEARALMPPGACRRCVLDCRRAGRRVTLCPRCSDGNAWVKTDVRRRAHELVVNRAGGRIV
jgi:hypothetical protein